MEVEKCAAEVAGAQQVTSISAEVPRLVVIVLGDGLAGVRVDHDHPRELIGAEVSTVGTEVDFGVGGRNGVQGFLFLQVEEGDRGAVAEEDSIFADKSGREIILRREEG